MKARKIKKLRKKISKKEYYKKRLHILVSRLEYWHHFYKFDKQQKSLRDQLFL